MSTQHSALGTRHSALGVTDEEREAGAFRLWFRFNGRDLRGKELREIFETDAELLIVLSLRRKLGQHFPQAKSAIERYLACPRIAAICGELRKSIRARREHEWRERAFDRRAERENRQKTLYGCD